MSLRTSLHEPAQKPARSEVTSWMRRKRLDEQRFLVRHYEISAALEHTFSADPEADAESGALTVASLEES